MAPSRFYLKKRCSGFRNTCSTVTNLDMYDPYGPPSPDEDTEQRLPSIAASHDGLDMMMCLNNELGHLNSEFSLIRFAQGPRYARWSAHYTKWSKRLACHTHASLQSSPPPQVEKWHLDVALAIALPFTPKGGCGLLFFL